MTDLPCEHTGWHLGEQSHRGHLVGDGEFLFDADASTVYRRRFLLEPWALEPSSLPPLDGAS